MAEPNNFHRGNRAEYLARFALGAIGYVVPVPREADRFGVDLLLHMGKFDQDVMRATGPSLAIQVKSNTHPIKLENDLLGSFFDGLEPLYIACVDVARGTLKIFSTHKRIAHSYYKDLKTLTLRLEREPRGFKNSGNSHSYYLGKPFVSLKISSLDDNDWRINAENFYGVLRSWCNLDLFNLACRSMRVPIFLKPRNYKTNQPLSLDPPDCTAIYSATLQRQAAESLVFVTHALAHYFRPSENNAELKALVEACQKCKSAATTWLSQ